MPTTLGTPPAKLSSHARRTGPRKWLSALLDLLYPPHCVACGRPGEWLCAACVEAIPTLDPPLCAHCGEPRGQPNLCPACRRGKSYLAGVRSLAYHVSPIREAIHALKYEGVRVLAGPLADLLARYWDRVGLPASAIVPVPLHPVRLRERGYNQSLLLARALGERTGLPVRDGYLVRVRNTPAQVGLSREERWDNVRDAFRCHGTATRGERVLLIDDVMTTGATLEACASALVQAGGEEVWALTLARAARRSDMPGAVNTGKEQAWRG